MYVFKDKEISKRESKIKSKLKRKTQCKIGEIRR
jgi:hypothetical protein